MPYLTMAKTSQLLFFLVLVALYLQAAFMARDKWIPRVQSFFVEIRNVLQVCDKIWCHIQP